MSTIKASTLARALAALTLAEQVMSYENKGNYSLESWRIIMHARADLDAALYRIAPVPVSELANAEVPEFLAAAI